MHVAVVQEVEPSATSFGVAITTWSIIQSLLRAGHRVTVCLVGEERAPHLAEVASLGVAVEVLQASPPARAMGSEILGRSLKGLRMAASPALEDFFPAVRRAPAMGELLDRIRPDAVLGYTFRALAATHGLTRYPRMSVSVELDHVVRGLRWRQTPVTSGRLFVESVLWRLASRKHAAFVLDLARPCEAVVNLAAHNAQWLRQHGVPHCVYLPAPTRDAAGPDWQRRRDALPARSRPKILMVGHLDGMATLLGLRLFFRETLPILERRLGPEAFEVHLVGNYPKRPDMVNTVLRSSPAVKLRGYVEDVNAEFLSADVLLVPTPLELGMRTRILEGFSFGCCVVAHRANAQGIPQMRHGENTLLAGDGPGLAEAVLAALRDSDLRWRLGLLARQTYEQHFSLETAGARLTAELERIARARST